MRYNVTVNLTISEEPDEDGFRLNSSMLSYYKQYKLTGDNFTDLAPRIDAVVSAIELVADKDVRECDG